MSGANNPFDRLREGARRFREVFEDNDSRDRGDTKPCPDANRTTIGTLQQFNLLCGRNIGGEVIDESQQPDFLTCIDRCASFHPRCDAVSFDGTECRLRAGTGIAESRSSKRFDSALGLFPAVQTESGCGSLGASTTSGSSQFDISCGFIINGNDMFQENTASFGDCLALCSQTAGCRAVSYDVNMDEGFQNCYIKRGNTDEGLLRLSRIDSAVVNNNAIARSSATPGGVGVIPVSVPSAPQESSSLPSTTPTPPAPNSSSSKTSALPAPETTSSVQSGAATTLTPLVSDTTISTAGVSLSTPSPVAAVTSSSITSRVTKTSTLEGRTTLLTSLLTSTQVLSLPPATATPADSNSTVVEGISSPTAQSNKTPAWIAAPVLGSLAAIVIIVAIFFALRRKGLYSTAITERGGVAGASAVSLARIGAWFRGWLPRRGYNDRYRFGENAGGRAAEYLGNLWRLARGGGGSGSRAHDEKLRATEQGIAGSRGTSRQGDDDDDGPVPTYELRQGKIALRNSVNGLAQNKPILDGIPDFLRK